MTRISLALLFVVSLVPRAGAHQLDEYLQAARLDVSRDRVGVELDLTPGISIAPQIITLIDVDADGSVSETEMGAYASQVIHDVRLQVDGRSSSFTLTRVRFPALADVREGMGTIRLEAIAEASVGEGVHRIAYENVHQPAVSVYLVNALKPSARGVVIGSQRRDTRQRRLEVDVEVSGGRERVAWCASASLLLVGWYALRRRSSRSV